MGYSRYLVQGGVIIGRGSPGRVAQKLFGSREISSLRRYFAGDSGPSPSDWVERIGK